VPEELRRRLRALARRAGLERVPDSVVLAAVVFCILLVAWAAWRWWPRAGAEVDLARPASGVARVGAPSEGSSSPASVEGTPAAAATESVWVHVVGAVRRPGVYELRAGSRVNAALDAAGGLLGNAAPAAVNLARPVQDGEQIWVPTKDEFAKSGGLAPPSPGGSSAGGSAGAGTAAQSPIDLNTADAALLDTLPGVGPSTAAKIVADREANGPFASVDDLGRVTGIGPKKLDALKDLVCVR
jgi:competence protein ComEA